MWYRRNKPAPVPHEGGRLYKMRPVAAVFASGEEGATKMANCCLRMQKVSLCLEARE